LKKLRQYRIPIKSNDNVEVDIISESKSFSSMCIKIDLANISSSGVGIHISTPTTLDDVFEVQLKYNKTIISGMGQVVRRYTDDAKEYIDYVGIEFVEIDSILLQNFIYDIVSNMPSKRLRGLMMDMIENEGRSVLTEEDSLEVSASIVTDLFHVFQKYNNSHELMYLFAQEIKRNIGAKDFRFYMFEHEGRDVSIFDFKEGKAKDSILPLAGHIKEVRDSGKVIKSRLTKGKNDDQFYNLLQTLFDINIDTFMLAPVVDKWGMIVGVIEFSNKDNHELFTEEDYYEVSLLSTIIGLNFSLTGETENFDYAKKLIKFYEKGLLIGTSEESRYLNSFMESSGKTDDNILICGEYGVGKKLIAIGIHERSERSSHGLGHVNCHDIDSEKSLKYFLNSQGEHIGALDLYSGGIIVFKDINFLEKELQEKLHEELKARDDIRFIATSTQTVESLVKEDHYLPLFDFFAGKSVRVPALRERKEDVIPLIHFYAYQLCLENDLAPKSISQEIINYFSSYDWPGNISELKIAIERLIILGRDLKTLVYKRNRVLPLLDREIDHDFTFGLDLHHDFLDHSDVFSSGDFEELYFYFYVEELVEMKNYSFTELSAVFDLDQQSFYEKLYHAHDTMYKYFGVNSELIGYYLEDKAVA
jgi:transcriptional regulator with GAF, ATPase, and Fis domain